MEDAQTPYGHYTREMSRLSSRIREQKQEGYTLARYSGRPPGGRYREERREGLGAVRQQRRLSSVAQRNIACQWHALVPGGCAQACGSVRQLKAGSGQGIHQSHIPAHNEIPIFHYMMSFFAQFHIYYCHIGMLLLLLPFFHLPTFFFFLPSFIELLLQNYPSSLLLLY